MTKHVHGGNVYQYKKCVDFSANCNPLGTPENVKNAVKESLDQVFNYPQVGYAPLKEALSIYENVNSRYLICGNGAAELIFSLCYARKPKKALLVAPTFAEYEQALAASGCKIERYFLEEANNFEIKEDYLDYLKEDLDILFLCNPNNPTGILLERDFLKKILDKCKTLGIFVVFDECFLDFIDKPEAYSMKKYLDENSEFFILKAFTKRYAIPGIRLGYGMCSNKTLLEHMTMCVQPWNVSTLAQAAGIAALKEEEYVKKGRDLIFKEKDYLMKELNSCSLKVFPSRANYIFFKGREDLFEKCVEKNILIRDCSNYEGLKKGFYRIAVKKHEDNEKLIHALKEIERE